jgi:membrane-bound lytic murein transglycosylase D
MPNNSNSSAKLFFLAIALIVSGCSDTPNEPLVINGPPPVTRPDTASSAYSSRYKYSSRYSSRPAYRQRTKSFLSQNGSVWERMISLYALPDYNNERIDQQLSWYLNHPDYIARIQERAAPYMHLILDEIEAKNLPGELALLPVVESAFIPEAYSRSAASGLWQFIPSTGRLYGLDQNSWYDGRRDVYASTKAATRFLKDLGDEFGGDYCLALASYNYGKGNVGKAIDRNYYNGLPTDYWSLDLPKETTDYVPRLLAIAKLFANADRYNVRLQNIPNKPYCEVVNVGSQLDLDKAAQLANTSVSHIKQLNPGFKKDSTPPSGPHHMLIPTSRAQTFKINLARLPFEERVDQRRREEELLAQRIRENEILAKKMRDEEERNDRQERSRNFILARNATYGNNVEIQKYKVHRGETLSSIARRYDTSVTKLRQVNNLSKTSVNSGTYLKVPASNSINQISKQSKPKTSGNGFVYVVKKGDTFFNISKRFAVSRNDIAGWNNISPNANVRLGQRLVIKGASPQLASASSTRLIHYKVKRGDTLTQLSRKFGVSVSEIRKSNPAAASRGIQPGQSLKIIVDNQDRGAT